MSGKPKNLLFLLADQFRHDALGAAGGRARTPNLDGLARRGALFTRAYAPLPVCAPARQALLLGRHPDSYGGYWNFSFLPAPAIGPGNTWPEQLQARGSRGGYVGKWDVTPAHTPADFGFDVVANPKAHDRLISEKYPGLRHEGGWMGCSSPVALEDAKTHFLAGQALSFIRQTRGPWHLWVDFGVPHLPCRPSAPFDSLYDPADIPPWPGYEDEFANKPYIHAQQSCNWGLTGMPWKDMAPQVARYYGMVSQLDDAIGRILRGLDELGQTEDTLIVFTSDHGDMCGNHRMLDKHYVLYEDTVRVPLILSGPGVPRMECDALVSNALDLPCTLAEIFDLPPPEGTHGRPLPLQGGPVRQTITSSTNGQQFGMYNARMVTDGRLKYVWNLTDVDECYDLAADPGELVNRINDPALAEDIARLRKALYEDLRAHGDPFANDWLAPQLLEGRKCR